MKSIALLALGARIQYKKLQRKREMKGWGEHRKWRKVRSCGVVCAKEDKDYVLILGSGTCKIVIQLRQMDK